MKKKDIEKYREMLINKAGDLKESYLRSKNSSLEKPDDGSLDPVDIASSSYNREFLLSLSDEERKVLRLVEEAMGRLDKGSYGKCVECDKVIGRLRLEAVPWAKHCITCQEKQEKGLI